MDRRAAVERADGVGGRVVIGDARSGWVWRDNEHRPNEREWKQFVGKAKEKWGRLTDDDWEVAEGKRDQLIGKIQERYGITREEAERQLGEFERM